VGRQGAEWMVWTNMLRSAKSTRGFAMRKILVITRRCFAPSSIDGFLYRVSLSKLEELLCWKVFFSLCISSLFSWLRLLSLTQRDSGAWKALGEAIRGFKKELEREESETKKAELSQQKTEPKAVQ